MTTSSFESGIFDPLTSGEGQSPRRRGGKASGPAGKGRAGGVDAQARRDQILNAYFDAGGTVSREKLRAATRADPRLAVDFERTEAVLSEMNLRERPVGGPDVSQAVLARVDELRPYVEAPIRRQVSSARIAGVGALLCGITLVVVLNQVRVSTAPLGRVGDDEPRTVATPAAAVARNAVSTGEASKSTLRRTGLGDAARQYDEAVRLTMTEGTLPTAATRVDRGNAMIGGGGSDDRGYSGELSPLAREKVSAQANGAEEFWNSFFFGRSRYAPVPSSGEERANAGAIRGDALKK